jgi:hypothetical protein
LDPAPMIARHAAARLHDLGDMRTPLTKVLVGRRGAKNPSSDPSKGLARASATAGEICLESLDQSGQSIATCRDEGSNAQNAGCGARGVTRFVESRS